MKSEWYNFEFSCVDRESLFQSSGYRRNLVQLGRVVFLVVLSLLVIATIDAQSPNGTISGLVVDSSGAAIVGAEILIANDSTGVQYPAKTNGEGFYLVTNLPPGTYRLQVSNSGFKTIIKPDIVIHVQDALAINFTLPIGAASEIVTVQGGAPLVNTESAAVSTVIDRKFVEALPLNGRSFNTLLQLTPGVSIVASNPEMPGQFSSNGQRSSSNYFQVDGVSANFGVAPQSFLFQAGGGGTQAFNAYGGTSSLVSVDAMQEFRVVTSSFAPEFGRSPGAQVLITTRSGTNDFHGTVFDYFRNTILDANDWFANRAGQPRAPEQQNDFGGVLGGPVWRDKTFFFFSYEGLRLLQPTTTVVTVPSNSARASAVPGAAPVLNSFPVPNGAVLGNGSTAQFTGTFSSRISMDAASLRLDHSFGHGLNVFGRFNWSPSEIVTRADALSEVRTVPTNTWTLTIGANEQIASRLYNSVRVNFSKQTAGQSSVLDAFGSAMPISAATLLPSPYSVSNGLAALNSLDTDVLTVGRASQNSESQFNILDDLDVTKGAHQLKFGEDYRHLNLKVAGLPIEAAYIYFTGAFSSSGNTLGAAFQGFRPGRILLPSISSYLQDTWRVSQRLTLTYGVRWDINPSPSAADGTILASWQNVYDPPATTLAPIGTPIFKTTYANFAPRLGVAYRLNQKGDFVVRGGWGIFYDLASSIAPQLAVSYPNRAFGIFFGIPIPDPNFSAHAQSLSFSTQPPFTGNIIAFDPNLKSPYADEWNVSIEKAIAGKQSVSVTYLGQAGQRLVRQEAIPAPNPNLPAGYNLINNDASSNYNALQVQYKRPLNRSVQALASYTWSHSIDTASDDVAGTFAPVISPVSADRGNSSFDVRHNFTGTLTYDLPAVGKGALSHVVTDGWSVASVFQVRSGFPIDISLNQGGTTISRPDLVPAMPVWIPDPTTGPAKKLNPNAFSVPSTLRQGTLPRNSIYGLGASQIDLSIQRRFALTERVHLDFRTDAFNAVNHPNFANPNGNVTNGQFGMFFQMLNKGLFGLSPLYQIGGPRSLQLSLKLSF
jgi:hypothetical protein